MTTPRVTNSWNIITTGVAVGGAGNLFNKTELSWMVVTSGP